MLTNKNDLHLIKNKGRVFQLKSYHIIAMSAHCLHKDMILKRNRFITSLQN